MLAKYKQIKEFINNAEHILLCTDERIDGDTIGSTLGMFHVLKAAGKRVTVFSPKPLDSTLAFLPGVNEITRNDAVFNDKSIDLAMIFDCADGVYIKPYLAQLPQTMPFVVFDHHSTNPLYGDVNVVEKTAASTADVTWRCIRSFGLPIPREAAQCLLTGIITDTSAFSNGGTTANSLHAAEELVAYGAKLQEIISETMMKKSLETLKLWGIAFERLHQNAEFNALTTAVTAGDIARFNATEDDARAISNFLSSMVEGADTILVLRETTDGGVKGSLRSVKRNVAEMAAQFGGGGHKQAAGFFVPNARLQQKEGVWGIVRN